MNITMIKKSDKEANFLNYDSFINTFNLDKKMLIEHFIHKNRVVHTFSSRKHSDFAYVEFVHTLMFWCTPSPLSINKTNAKPF